MRAFHSPQVSPATAGNECSFNLRLIAEWHFPFLLLPSSYLPDLSGKIQLARIGARRLVLHDNNDVNWTERKRKKERKIMLSTCFIFCHVRVYFLIFTALFCTCDFFHNVKFMANKHKSFFLLTVKKKAASFVCNVHQWCRFLSSGRQSAASAPSLSHVSHI